MTREKNLAKNTLIISIGKISTQMITFFLLPLYTGLLSTEEYGIVDLLNTLVSLFLPIVTFQIEQAVFRKLIENRDFEKNKNSIISNSIIFVIFQSVIFILLFLIVSVFIDNKYKYLLMANVVVSIFSSLFLQISRGLGNNFKFSVASFISAFSSIILNVSLLLLFRLRVEGILIGTFLGQLVCIIYLFFALKMYNFIDFKLYKKQEIKQMCKYSFPLVPNTISWWIFNASDRVIVSYLLGLSYNGILSAASKFSSVYISIYNIFNMSWVESISLYIKDKDIKNYFCKIFNSMISLFGSLSILMIAFMPFLYPMMINNNYSYGYKLVPILIVASFFNVIVGLLSALYIANKDTKSIANTSIVSAIINIVSHIILIEFIGLYAAAVSTFLSFFIMTVYRIYDVKKRYFEIVIDYSMLIKIFVIMIFIIFTYYYNNFYFNLLSILLSLIGSICLNKKMIFSFINIIKSKFKKG